MKLLIATNNQGKIKELHELLDDLGVELVTPSQIGLDLDVIEDGTTYTENATKKAIAFANASGLISLADDSGLEVDALNGEPGLYSARYGSDVLPLNSQNLGGVRGGQKKLSDAERRKYLISKLQGKPRPWTARFRAVISIAIPTLVTLSDSQESLPPQAGPSLALPGTCIRGKYTSGASIGRNDRFLTPSRHPSGRVTNTEGTCEGEIIPDERGTGGFGYDPIFLLTGFGKTMAELPMEEKNRLSHRARAVMKARGVLKVLFLG